MPTSMHSWTRSTSRRPGSTEMPSSASSRREHRDLAVRASSLRTNSAAPHRSDGRLLASLHRPPQGHVQISPGGGWCASTTSLRFDPCRTCTRKLVLRTPSDTLHSWRQPPSQRQSTIQIWLGAEDQRSCIPLGTDATRPRSQPNRPPHRPRDPRSPSVLPSPRPPAC
jgi:hypothetical protein